MAERYVQLIQEFKIARNHCFLMCVPSGFASFGRGKLLHLITGLLQNNGWNVIWLVPAAWLGL